MYAITRVFTVVYKYVLPIEILFAKIQIRSKLQGRFYAVHILWVIWND